MLLNNLKLAVVNLKEDVTSLAVGGVAVAGPAFIKDSLSHMIPWLIASFAVIVCDLVFGLRKSLLMKEEIRVSKAIRRTMGKVVTYFAFVCTVCMVEVAAGSEYGIDKWACLSVCAVEFSSIISNILKPKGVSVNFKKLLAILAGKVLKEDEEKIEEVIGKDANNGNNSRTNS